LTCPPLQHTCSTIQRPLARQQILALTYTLPYHLEHVHSPLPLGARTLSPTTWSTYTLPYHLEHLHSPLPLGALTLSPTTWSTGACTSAATTTAVLGCCDKFQEIYLLCSSHSIHNVWTADGGLQLLQRLVDQLHPLKCKVAACSVKLDDKERPWWA